MKTTCPVCASPDAERKTHTELMTVPYGPDVSFVSFTIACPVCDESYVSDENPEEGGLEVALRESKSSSAVAMLDSLSGVGHSNAYFERALRLPARTTARWKSGEFSASSLALLRLVRTFPWLLEVADADFDPRISAGTVLQAAGAVVLEAIQFPCTATFTMAASPSGYEFGTHLRLERPEPEYIDANIIEIKSKRLEGEQ